MEAAQQRERKRENEKKRIKTPLLERFLLPLVGYMRDDAGLGIPGEGVRQCVEGVGRHKVVPFGRDTPERTGKTNEEKKVIYRYFEDAA